MPTLAALAGDRPFGVLDIVGIVVALVGFLFEAIGDAQMAAFKADPVHEGQVMDRGLWRYTRHPNYFGEACFWWGIWLLALAAGGADAVWTVLSPALMTVLLLKVSGVALLEKDMVERRPAYRDYIARTNAFIPGPPRREES
jgi:steroid 5-alpha reductase family enzyme